MSSESKLDQDRKASNVFSSNAGRRSRFNVVLLMTACQCANVRPATADEFGPLRDKIRVALVEHSVPSLAVAVARDGRILWEQGFGWANREERTPATEHTLYSLASISKPITATGLMLLAERGQLDLDRPANDYLGPGKLTAHLGDAAEATLRRLANHTSGLPLHYQFFYADEAFRRPPMDETIRRYGHLVNEPGETFRYANLGYGVLDDVIARVSGRTFAEFMRQEVFLPLGLTRMSVDIGPGLEPHAAARYAEDGTPLPFYEFDHPGGSAVYASAHDLVRFGLLHLKRPQHDQKAILSDAAIDRMQVPTTKVDGTIGYGAGWFINSDEHGVRTISHSGGMGGVRTRLVLAPDQGIAVAVLCNAASELAARFAEETLAALIPVYAERLAAAASPKEPADPQPPFTSPTELVGIWRGAVQTYERELPLEIVVREHGDIHVRLEDQLWTLLNESKFEDGCLLGKFASDIGTADANRRPYHLHLNARLRGDVLNGSLTAISLPAPRPGNALSHWVELRRQPAP
jgi:CubicO group peptidase (beta-lactamase class C family)